MIVEENRYGVMQKEIQITGDPMVHDDDIYWKTVIVS